MTSAVWIALALAVSALPLSQMVWIPLTHYRFRRYYRRLGATAPRLGFTGSLGYYWRALIANLTMAWWMVAAFGRDGLRQPTGDVTGPAVLCIHGYLRNGTCMWGYRRALARRGRSTAAVSMGRPLRTIEDYVPPVANALRNLTAAHPGEQIDIIAHSMGGVVLRSVLATEPELAAAVHRIVTLGSPHRGTAAVAGLPGVRETRQLNPQSAFVHQLPDFRTSVPQAEVVTVAAELDFVVYPRDTSHLEGSETLDLPTSHPGLLTERPVIERVVDELTTRARG
ncbi:MAG: alpha/beta fold hydrolase [Acidobacteriota bacterium]